MIFSQIHSQVPGGPAVAAVIAVAGVSAAVSACEVPLAFAVFIEPDGLAAIVVPGFATVGLCPAIAGVLVLLVSLLFLMSLLLLASLLLSTPYCCKGPWFRELTPTGVPIVACIIGVASVPAGVSIPAVAAWLPYSLLASLVFKVSPASFLVTVLSPTFLLMLASCCCWRPAAAGVTALAGVSAIAGIPTNDSVPVGSVDPFVQKIRHINLLKSSLTCGHWPYHYVLIIIAYKLKIMGSNPALDKSEKILSR
jgi:hypothetical protein